MQMTAGAGKTHHKICAAESKCGHHIHSKPVLIAAGTMGCHLSELQSTK